MKSNPKLFFPAGSEEPFPRFPRFPRYTRYFHVFHDKIPPRGGHPRSIHNSVFLSGWTHLDTIGHTPLFATTLRASEDRRSGKPISGGVGTLTEHHQLGNTTFREGNVNHGQQFCGGIATMIGPPFQKMSVTTYAQIHDIHSRSVILDPLNQTTNERHPKNKIAKLLTSKGPTR
jgi:hypothetical protein